MAVAAKLNAVLWRTLMRCSLPPPLHSVMDYKLIFYQTEAEKGSKWLNETIKEADKSLQSELYQINLMFQVEKPKREGRI